MNGTSTHAPERSRVEPPQRMTEPVRNMLQLSLLGCLYGDDADVQAVRHAVEANVRDKKGYRLYIAIVKGIAGDGSFAAELLQQHPHDDFTKVMLAAAMKQGRHPGWCSVVDEVLALSTDVDAREKAILLRDAR